jgi:DNA (cytosine-5)-methyltransferase 1
MPLAKVIEHIRKYHPNSKILLHASLECTNFSKAKGGQPRDADSRTLGIHLYRYIEVINPDYIQIENVEEFMTHSWTCKGKAKKDPKDFLQWAEHIKAYGYDFKHSMLNAADFGAYTSRKRFFGQFAKNGLPIAWPDPTHAKKQLSGLFGQLKQWKPVKDVLDFSDEGESIFSRKKPLSDKTLERIYAGLIKFVAGGKDKWLLKYNSINGTTGKHVPPSVDEPCPVISCQGRLGIVNAKFLSKYYSGHPDSKNKSINEPADTITAIDHHSLVSANFIQQRNGGNPKHKVVSVERPAQTITANRKWHYLMNPQYFNAGGSVENPCFTIIARMDKMPPYLVSTEAGQVAIEVYEADTEPMRKIKEFMALYGIIDIKMRMLKIPELKRIMGFPEDYTLIGTQAEQKKYIGNAVEVNMARVLCEAMVIKLHKMGFLCKKMAIN